MSTFCVVAGVPEAALSFRHMYGVSLQTPISTCIQLDASELDNHVSGRSREARIKHRNH